MALDFWASPEINASSYKHYFTDSKWLCRSPNHRLEVNGESTFEKFPRKKGPTEHLVQ